MAKAPVYPNAGPTLEKRIEQLRHAVSDLAMMEPPEKLMTQLRDAVDDVEEAVRATLTIKKGNYQIGYGVSKAEKAIACDAVMSVVRAIKSSKGW